jgi:predicted secreted protein
MNATIAIISKNEGLTLAEFQTKNLTFKTPIKLKMKSDERLVLMLEQIISTDYVWDVMKSSEALKVYLSGDYSVPPRVLRSLNQVDAPIRILLIP